MDPIVAIPGTLCDARVFGLLSLHLAGLQPGPAVREASVEAAAGRILADAPGRFVALGFSMGGFVALELLRRAPERLSGVIMMASNTHALPASQRDARDHELALAADAGVEAVALRAWDAGAVPAARAEPGRRQLVAAMATAVGATGFAAQTALAIARPDSGDLIATTGVPVLALCGDADALCPPERCCLHGPTVTAVVLPGCGHFIPLEAPQAAAAAIAGWGRRA